LKTIIHQRKNFAGKKENFMRKTVIASCLAAALSLGLVGGSALVHAAETSAVIATGQNPGPWRLLVSGQFGRLLTLRSELNISADQRQHIKLIFQSHRPEIAASLRPLVEKRRALQDAVMAEPTDEPAIRAAAGNLATSLGDAAVLAAKIRSEVANVLTPEQQAKVADFRRDSRLSVDHFLDNLAKPM
jgi:Spy/CpxP family protein refolding chaperone